MPEKDEFLEGHKYPFNSCEILCSDNGLNLSKLLRKPLVKYLKRENEKQIEEKEFNEEKELKKEINYEEDKKNEKDNIDNKNEILKENKKEEENIEISNQNKEIKNEEINDKTDLDNKNKNESNIIKEIKDNEQNIIEGQKEEKKDEIKEVKDEIKENNEKIENIKEEKQEEIKEEEIDNINKEEENFDNPISSINDNSEEEEKEIGKEKEEYDIIDEKENEKIINEEILDYLFKFLDNESSIVNPVLSGYFNKIINFLLKKNTKLLLQYFFDINGKIIYKLLDKIGIASIENIIENIVNALSDKIISDSDKHFYDIIDYLIGLISKNETNDEIVESICQLIINCIVYNNKLKFSDFIESSFIEKIKDQIKKLYENKEKNEKKIIFVVELVTKINNNILINFENRITPKINLDAGKVEIINIIKINDRNSYQYYILNDGKNNTINFINTYILYLQNYCQSLNEICLMVINDIITDNNLGKNTKKFGLYNIYKFEFICSVIDLYLNNLLTDAEKRLFINEKIDELIKTKIFNKINNLFFTYKNINMYANIYSQIIEIISNENSPKNLIENILIYENTSEKNLINLLIDDIINNLKYIYEESKNEMYNLAFSNEINILNILFSSKNISIKEIIDKNINEKFFYEMMVQNIMNQFNKKLYKINDNIEQKKIDVLNPYFDAQKEQSECNIPFSLQSFNEIVSLYLLVYQKYIKNEDYKGILKDNEELLEVSIYLII